jgi:hypothetical protein
MALAVAETFIKSKVNVHPVRHKMVSIRHGRSARDLLDYLNWSQCTVRHIAQEDYE